MSSSLVVDFIAAAEPAGTNLTASTAGGVTWAKVPGSGDDYVFTAASRVRPGGGAGDPFYYASSFTPDSPDYALRAAVYCATDAGAIALAARIDTATGNAYLLQVSAAGLEIRKRVGTVRNAVGTSSAFAFTDGQTYVVDFVLTGPVLRGYVSGVLLAQAFDGGYAAAGAVGLEFGFSGSDAAGFHVGWFGTPPVLPRRSVCG